MKVEWCPLETNRSKNSFHHMFLQCGGEHLLSAAHNAQFRATCASAFLTDSHMNLISSRIFQLPCLLKHLTVFGVLYVAFSNTHILMYAMILSLAHMSHTYTWQLYWSENTSQTCWNSLSRYDSSKLFTAQVLEKQKLWWTALEKACFPPIDIAAVC